METPKFTQEQKPEKSVDDESIYDRLTHESFSDLTKELRTVFKEKAEHIKPSDVLSVYERSERFFGPSEIDQREQHKYRSCFFDVLPEHFRALDLSPVAPIGTNVSVTNLSQDVLCTTIRQSEVQGDPTTALALEASKQRKYKSISKKTILESVDLATASRVLRMQNFDESKGYMQHYNLFGLYSAGRDVPGLSFVEKTTIDHIFIWLNLIQQLEMEGLVRNSGVEVKISDIRIIDSLIRTLNVSQKEINKNVLNDDWDLFENYAVDLPSEVQSISEIPAVALVKYGIKNAVDNMAYKEHSMIQRMRDFYPEVKFSIELNRKGGLGYYNNLCFNVFVKKVDDDSPVLVAGGGSVDWSSKLLGNAKERGYSSGFGPEFVQKILS